MSTASYNLPEISKHLFKGLTKLSMTYKRKNSPLHHYRHVQIANKKNEVFQNLHNN